MVRVDLVRCLVRYGDKYLLLKRAKDDIFPNNVGKWECPGGRIDAGESPEKTALRELEEETGLKGKIVRELPFLQMNDGKIDSKCNVYLVKVQSDKIKLSDKHSDYVWLRADEVKEKELVRFASLLLEYFNNPKIYLSS